MEHERRLFLQDLELPHGSGQVGTAAGDQRRQERLFAFVRRERLRAERDLDYLVRNREAGIERLRAIPGVVDDVYQKAIRTRGYDLSVAISPIPRDAYDLIRRPSAESIGTNRRPRRRRKDRHAD